MSYIGTEEVSETEVGMFHSNDEPRGSTGFVKTKELQQILNAMGEDFQLRLAMKRSSQEGSTKNPGTGFLLSFESSEDRTRVAAAAMVAEGLRSVSRRVVLKLGSCQACTSKLPEIVTQSLLQSFQVCA